MANDETYKAAGIIGILILLCGIGDTITGILWIAKFAVHGIATNGSGLWSGVPLIIAGALGVGAWPKRNRGMMIGFLVMCIIACILASIQAIVSGYSHAIWVRYTGDAKCYTSGSGCFCNSNSGSVTFNDPKACDLISTLVGGLLAFIILSTFGALLTLSGSIIACMVTCGSQQSPGAVIVHQPPTTGVVITSSQTHSYANPQQPMGYPQQFPQGYPQQFPQGYPQQFPEGYPQQASVLPQYSEKPTS